MLVDGLAHPACDAAYAAALLAALYDPLLPVALLLPALPALLAAHDVDLVLALLRTTEVTHKAAIEATVDAVSLARTLPASLRGPYLDALLSVVRGGDAVGSRLLDLLEEVVRGRLL